MRLKLAILIVLLYAAPGWGATYTIGSGETYTTFTALVAAVTLDDNDIVDGKGETFRETWTPNGSGSEGAVITLRNATVTCYDPVTTFGSIDGNGEYRKTITTEGSRAIRGVIRNHGGVTILTKGTPGSLSAGEWGYSAGVLYYKLAAGQTDPNDGTVEVNYRHKAIDIDTLSYITVSDITIYGGSGVASTTDGNALQITDSTNITVDDCLLYYGDLGGIDVYATDGGTQPTGISITNNTISYYRGFGIHLTGYDTAHAPTGAIITGNTIEYIGTLSWHNVAGYDVEGIGYNGKGATTAILISNNVIRHIGGDYLSANRTGIYMYQTGGDTISGNTVSNCAGSGIRVTDGTGPYGQNVIVKGNLVTSCGASSTQKDAIAGGIVIKSSNGGGLDGTSVVNNTVSECNDTADSTANGGGGIAIQVGNYSNDCPLTVKNNILYNNTTYGIQVRRDGASGALTGLDADYNLYYPDTGTKFKYFGTEYNFADWKTNSSQDANSLSSDPLLTATYGLNSTSPAIDGGVYIEGVTGATYDCVDGAGVVDIGWEEYVCGNRGWNAVGCSAQ
jgi:parallel beta-helix repeat protein